MRPIPVNPQEQTNHFTYIKGNGERVAQYQAGSERMVDGTQNRRCANALSGRSQDLAIKENCETNSSEFQGRSMNFAYIQGNGEAAARVLRLRRGLNGWSTAQIATKVRCQADH